MLANRIKNAAEGYLALGMSEKTFMTMEDLPPKERRTLDVLAMRVLISRAKLHRRRPRLEDVLSRDCGLDPLVGHVVDELGNRPASRSFNERAVKSAL